MSCLGKVDVKFMTNLEKGNLKILNDLEMGKVFLWNTFLEKESQWWILEGYDS